MHCFIPVVFTATYPRIISGDQTLSDTDITKRDVRSDLQYAPFSEEFHIFVL